jgi:4-hydroxybenzoate polyprenyltransferase
MAPFVLAAFTIELRPDVNLLLLGFAFIFARELLIDLQDSHSDRAWGIRTIDELFDHQFIRSGSWITLILVPFLGAALVTSSISVTFFLASALINLCLFPIYIRNQSKGLVLTRLSMLFAVLGIAFGFGAHSSPLELW